MELIQYLRLLRRWFWLLLLAAFVGGSFGFISRSSQPAEYQAQTQIAIGSFIQSPNPDQSEIRTGLDLAQTYAELVTTHDVLEGTVEALNLPMSPGALRGLVSTRIKPGTSLLVVSVTYTDPVLAADIANELARQLILESPSNLTPDQQAQIDIANEQIETLNNQLDTLQLRLGTIDEQLAAASDQDQLDRLSDQRSTLIDQINQATANIAQFTNTIASLQQRTNSLDIVESARTPGSPTGPGVFSATVLAAMVAASLAFGAVLLLEYLNDTIRTADEAAQMLAMPVLGVISRFGKSADGYRDRLITGGMLFSQTPEEYRTLRTNLLFTTAPETEDAVRKYIITSPAPQEGKSVTTANLAVSMALADMKVLLIDADMRRPKIHEIFGLKNDVGLTSLFGSTSSNGASAEATYRRDDVDVDWKQVMQDPGIPNLRVITSGFTTSKPAELLGSSQMKYWIKVFSDLPGLDVVLFDTPPCLAVSDSTLLATAAGGDVILVVEAGSTRRTAALRAKERFEMVGHELAGVVINRANPNEEDYYGYYGYYYAPEREPVQKK